MKKQTKLGLVLAAAAVISVSVASLVSARGWVQQGAEWYYVDNSNEYVTETIQSSGNSKFYLGEDGAMQRDYFLEDYNGNTYYFGQNGAMVTNTWVAIESSRVENQDEYVPDNYWYYFQSSGKAMKASSGNLKKTTIDGKKYGFNEYGQMVTGWVDASGKVINPDDNENPFENAVYYAGGDNDGILRAGWLTYYDGYDGDGSAYAAEYTNLYFYFNTSNNTKYAGQTKKINGRTYAFDNDGIMLSGWDVKEYNGSLIDGKTAYFSGQDDGHQVKKGWVYAVPSEEINLEDYNDDELSYMYFNASGEIVRDQFKKINGKYYVFNRSGIMKTGIVIWAPDSVAEFKNQYEKNADGSNNTSAPIYDYYRYVGTIDLDWATGEELARRGWVRYDDEQNDYFRVNPEGIVVGTRKEKTEGTTKVPAYPANISRGDQIKLHYFAEDGSRKTGQNNIEFADETYTFYTTSSGDKGSGTFSKKYYSLGVQLKANSDIRYGIYNVATQSNIGTDGVEDWNVGEPLGRQSSGQPGNIDSLPYRQNLLAGNYQVLNTGGSMQKGQTSAKKDADGNFWFIERNTNALRGIFSVNVKSNASFGTGTKTRVLRVDNADLTQLRAWDETDYIATTGQIIDLVGTDFFDEDLNEELADLGWYTNVSNNRVYFNLSESYSGYGYQSDVNDQTNKWIPYGVFDNTGKTVIADPTYDHTNKQLHGYEVTPNNDYFLNCFWNY